MIDFPPEDYSGAGLKVFVVVRMEYDLSRNPIAAFATRDEAAAFVDRLVALHKGLEDWELPDTYFIYSLGLPAESEFDIPETVAWEKVAR